MNTTPQCFTQQNCLWILEEILGAWLSCENLFKLSSNVSNVMASRFGELEGVAWVKSETILRNSPLLVLQKISCKKIVNIDNSKLRKNWKTISGKKFKKFLSNILLFYILFNYFILFNIFLHTLEILLVWLYTTTIKWIL